MVYVFWEVHGNKLIPIDRKPSPQKPGMTYFVYNSDGIKNMRYWFECLGPANEEVDTKLLFNEFKNNKEHQERIIVESI